VTWRLQLEGGADISIPASALTSIDRQPAVWIVDPANLTVALRNVEVQRFDPASAVGDVHLSQRKFELWEAVTAREELPPGLMAGNLRDSGSYNCRPIVEAGQALLVDDTFQLDYDFTLFQRGLLAVPLLRQHPLAGPERGRHRLPDAPCAAMPGAGLVDDL
jgi:hypothetical protein